jgi:DNA invertase Pin-like site-specific DNA recombinase
MPKRAYSYLRFSSRKQGKGDSERRQSVRAEPEEMDPKGMAAFADEVCRQEDAILDDTQFCDRGVSARRGKNALVGALARFLQLIDSGRVTPGSVFIFENLDRLSRDKLPRAMKLFMGILEAGITIWTARPRRRYTLESVSDLAGIIEPLVHMVRAYEESERKSELLRAVWARKKRAAAANRLPLGKTCPAWVRRAGAGYEPRHPHWETVQAVCRLATDGGLGFGQLAQTLAAEPQKYPPMGRSGVWTPEYLWTVLHSRALVGEYQPRRRDERGKSVPEGKPIPGYYPALLTEEEFWRLQAAIAGRRGRRGRPARRETNLFTGILYDARTGQRLSVQTNHASSGKCYPYLISYRQARRGRAGAGTRMPYRECEAGILRAIGKLNAADVRPQRADPVREDRATKLTADLTVYGHKARLLRAQITDPNGDPEALGELIEAAKELGLKQAAAARELKRLQMEGQSGREETLGETQSLLALWGETRGTAEEAAMANRIRGRLEALTEGIWVLVQPLSRQKRILHLQIYLRGARPIYHQVIPRRLPPGTSVWQLAGCDFRAGDIGDAAGRPRPAKLVS